ncbi:MAG: rRNA maturation RNase YbeY [Patescibacteria group bacterium]
MTVDILEEQPLPIAAVLVEQQLQAVFAHYHPTNLQDAVVELLVTDDQQMQTLNQTHRGIDKTTDVLSLPTAIDSKQGTVLPMNTETPLHLGTIVISLPQAIRQIGRFGETLEAELLGLFEHGLRHLLGHDHDDAGQWTNDVA